MLSVPEYEIQRGSSGEVSSEWNINCLTPCQWSDPWVFVPLALAGCFFIIFILVELLVAPEPILAPYLLKQKVPVLVGISNFLVALCNFSVMYFLPMWFQTVALTSASMAGRPPSIPF